MKKAFVVAAIVGFGLTAVVTWVGCSPSRTSTRTSWMISQADLDEYRRIEFSYDVVRDHEGRQLVREYEQLLLRIGPREDLRVRRAVKTVELTPGDSRPQVRFENVEARANETRERIWFVERETGRIVATFDSSTDKTTGPDEPPPPWATPTGGVLLESSTN